jgi:hypothetical protein
MIRNLLYSIFLHIALVLAIYFSIESIYIDQYLANEDQIIVSIAEPKIDKIVKAPKKPKTIIKNEKKPIIKKQTKNITKKPDSKLLKKPKKSIKSTINKPTHFLKHLPIKKKDIEDPQKNAFDPEKLYLENDYYEDLESLDLTNVHKRSIKNQLNFCFSDIFRNQNINKKIAKNIEITFQISKSGALYFDIDKNFHKDLLTLDEYYNYQRIINKIAKSTKKCAIFRNLPPSKYHIWKEFRVLFKT